VRCRRRARRDAMSDTAVPPCGPRVCWPPPHYRLAASSPPLRPRRAGSSLLCLGSRAGRGAMGRWLLLAAAVAGPEERAPHGGGYRAAGPSGSVPVGPHEVAALPACAVAAAQLPRRYPPACARSGCWERGVCVTPPARLGSRGGGEAAEPCACRCASALLGLVWLPGEEAAGLVLAVERQPVKRRSCASYAS